jgi:hypothetical protein
MTDAPDECKKWRVFVSSYGAVFVSDQDGSLDCQIVASFDTPDEALYFARIHGQEYRDRQRNK